MIFDKIQDNRMLKRYKKDSDKILALEEKFANMSNEELKNFSISLFNGEKDKYGQLPVERKNEAFALVREATYRATGLKQYPVQIIGGLALLEGNISEMNTGEGKTLMSYFPAYIRALTGENVHVITSNEYLAKRDAEQAEKVFDMLGISVGFTASGMSKAEKREAYNKNITYATATEIGFDYLRDQNVINFKDKVQRGLNYAIIDEVDNALLDEASIPLIISGYTEVTDKALIKKAYEFISTLDEEDIEYDDEHKTVYLSDSCDEKIEEFFGLSFSDEKQEGLVAQVMLRVTNALKAEKLMKRNVDYAVIDGKIEIIDRFTNRILKGRMFSRGLHQAIEAKEGLEISNQNRSLSQITIGDLINQYKVRAGMTGTASTEKNEFNSVYSMDVVKIPTNKENQRVDHPMSVFASMEDKNLAIIRDVMARHAKGQPVLIGVSSVEMSKVYEKLLKEFGIEYNVLNAIDHEKEDFVIAQAGRKGAVTIATNMAGRGTDISLGGNSAYMAKEKMKELGYDIHQISLAESTLEGKNEEEKQLKALYKDLKNEFNKVTAIEKKEVMDVGGLCVIGTEPNISRRVDDQLKGRAGRQGDKGESKIYCSFDDAIISKYIPEEKLNFLKNIYSGQHSEIKGNAIKKMVLNFQKTIEGHEFSMRKHTRTFGSAFDQYRKVYQEIRDNICKSSDFKSKLVELFKEKLGKEYNREFTKEENRDVYKHEKRIQEMLDKYGIKLEECNKENLYYGGQTTIDELASVVTQKYIANVQMAYGNGYDIDFKDKIIFLKSLERMWSDYIDEMSDMSLTAGTTFLSSSNYELDIKIRSGKIFGELFTSTLDGYLNNIYFSAKLAANTKEKKIYGLKNDEHMCKLANGKHNEANTAKNDNEKDKAGTSTENEQEQENSEVELNDTNADTLEME